MRPALFYCLLAAVALTACKDGEKPADAQSAGDIEIPAPVTATDEPAGWLGNYSGTLPCWNGCDGLKTNIEVRSDSTYTLSSHALGLEDKPNVYTGSYHFDKAKNTITLDAEGDHLKFLVQEGMLKKLDKFGEPEQGAPQERYMLHRAK